MPASIRTHSATQPDSASLESLTMLADRALASENDVDESKPGVAESKVSEIGKLVGLLEDLYLRLKKLETATSTMAAEKRRNSGRAQTSENRAPEAQCAPTVQTKTFTPTNKKVNRRGLFTNTQPPNRHIWLNYCTLTTNATSANTSLTRALQSASYPSLALTGLQTLPVCP